MSKNITNTEFQNKIIELLQISRRQIVKTINTIMVTTYFDIGKMIVEEEQKGEGRAEYGKQLLKDLSRTLTKEFGKGFSVTNIQQMRNFYLTYRKQQTVSAKSEKDKLQLSWSHYIFLMRIDDINERKFYEIETFKNSWSLRELKRQ